MRVAGSQQQWRATTAGRPQCAGVGWAICLQLSAGSYDGTTQHSSPAWLPMMAPACGMRRTVRQAWKARHGCPAAPHASHSLTKLQCNGGAGSGASCVRPCARLSNTPVHYTLGQLTQLEATSA